MKGLHIVHAVRSDAFAGVERYVCDVAGELVRRGCRVGVVGGDPERMKAELPSGASHHPARTTVEVFKAMRATSADVVHTHMTAADLAVALAVRPARRPALVSTRHFTSPRGRSPLLRPTVRWAMSRYDVRVAISDFVAGTGQDAGEVVLRNGSRSGGLVPVAQREKSVVVVQRHEPEKQTDLALRAWARSRLRGEGWRLRLVGAGSQTPKLLALATELGITDSLDVLGFVPDAAPLMASAGAMLATTPAEGFGLAVVEAMASGTPVVATAAGGHLETLGPGGWLFPAGDVEGCAAALDRLSAEPAAVQAYGQHLWQRQRQQLSLESHVDRLLDLYRTALSHRRWDPE